MLRVFSFPLVLCLLSSGYASAACSVGPISFQFGSPTPISTVVVSDTNSGEGSCLLGFRGGVTVSYDSIRPVTGPTSGKLVQHSSKLGWTYTPKAGFKGADKVSLRVCGKYEKNSGCTIINYAITVR
jgi:hypothetical protein